MPDAPAVSIVLPVYNGLAYLEQSIASVLGQTCTSWELVVVDDGSDDGTAEYLATLEDPRIRTVAEEHTGNLSRVRNVGIAASSATWVAFLDADDVWLPHKLERQLAFHAAHPGIRWSYTGRMVIDASGARLPDEKFPWHPVSGWILPDLLVHAAKIASPTMMVERALLQELGGLDERFHYAGDYELRLRLAAGWECGVVAEPLAMIRQHRASRTTRRPESALALAGVYREFSRSAHAADFVRICRKQETFYRLKAARIRFGRREWRSAWHTLGSGAARATAGPPGLSHGSARLDADGPQSARRQPQCFGRQPEGTDSSMSKVLVIGGTLFIGRALVRRLLERGDEVVILHRVKGTPFGDAVGEIRCDRNDAGAVRAALRGERFDVVFDNVYDWERGTTAAQVEAAARACADGLRRYVFMSSIAAYGGGLDRDEDDPLAPATHPNDYARQKAESERSLFRMHAESGFPAATLRPAFVYGPGNPMWRETFFWDLLRSGRAVVIPGEGERLMQFAHVEDVARAALLAAENDTAAGRAYNLGSDPLTQVAYVRALARAAGAEPELMHVPRERIEAAGGSLFRPNLYFGEYYDLPSLTVRTERVRRELGLEPTPLDEGLRETFLSYQATAGGAAPDFAWYDGMIASVR